MDVWSGLMAMVGAVFGAGSTYGVLTTRLSKVEVALKEHKDEYKEGLQRIDSKLDNITNHLIEISHRK